MFRFERTETSRPPTVFSSPPSRLGELVFDCTMTLTRASPLPDKMSRCRSGEILALLVRVLFAARAFVLVEMNSAEHRETSTAAVTKRFRAWGRDIQFLQDRDQKRTSAPKM